MRIKRAGLMQAVTNILATSLPKSYNNIGIVETIDDGASNTKQRRSKSSRRRNRANRWS